MGLRPHAVGDRLLGDETTLGVMRAGAAPVLGVVASAGRLPRRAVVGIDFGRAGARAARAALDVLDGEGTLVLAYASYSYPPTGRAEEEGERVVTALGIEAACARAVAELAAPPGVSVETRVIEIGAGTTPADALLRLAAECGADLLAAGARRAGRLERLLLGSVTADLVRDGRRSVLVVPPEPGEPRRPGR
jgi:nucleotide-binding universal stress UspA family protein